MQQVDHNPFFFLFFFFFQAQLRASLAKLWDLEVPTQVRSPKRGPSGDIDCGSPECPVHTPSLYSFFFFFLLSEATSSTRGSKTTQGGLPGGEFFSPRPRFSLFLYLGRFSEQMNGKEYEGRTCHICWFKNSGASWVKYETWLHPQRAR